MKKFVLITKNLKIILTEEELSDFLNRARSGTLIELKGNFVNKNLIDGIYEFDFFLKMEEDQLKPKGLKRCKKCGEIGNRLDKCGCGDQFGEIKLKGLFSQLQAPSHIKKLNNPQTHEEKSNS